jgi:hypothetical protein
MHMPAGAINRASDNASNLDFTCTFRWDATLLQVTTTVPPVGGTFSPPAPGDYTYDVNFNEALDPASVQTGDLVVSGTATPSVTAVTVVNSNMTARFTVHFAFGGTFTASIGAGAVTDSFGNPNAAFTGSYNVAGCPPQQYVKTTGTDAIVPGTSDIGSHCDDCDTVVALPFAFHLYDRTYNSVNVSSNGRLDFNCVNETGGYLTSCLPAGTNQCSYDYTIFALWHDLRTDVGLSGCSTWTNGCGIFTSVSGTPPNRIFNIEWHAVEYANTANTANFEVRLYENTTPNRFDIVYGGSPNIVTSDAAGVQGNSAAGFFTQDFCSTTPPQNASRSYTIPICGSTVNLVSAASRLTHGTAGSFDVTMPLTGTSGVEDRNGGGTYLAVFTFDAPVTSGTAMVTSGTATAGTPVFSGNEMQVPLSGVADQQTIIIHVANVNGGSGSNDVTFGFLVADVNGNRVVDKPDQTDINTHKNQIVNATNFRDDINLSGKVDKPDLQSVQANRGHRIP